MGGAGGGALGGGAGQELTLGVVEDLVVLEGGQLGHELLHGLLRAHRRRLRLGGGGAALAPAVGGLGGEGVLV